MENSLGNSHGTEIPKKSRSLDLKSLYKSGDSKESSENRSLKRKESSVEGSNTNKRKKSRKLRMESHEEKLHKLVMQSKINETKDVMKRKASETDKSKIDKNRGDKGGFTSMGSGRIESSFSELSISSSGSRFGSGSGFGGLTTDLDAFSTKPKGHQPSSATAPPKGFDMQLDKSQKANQFLESLKAEGELIVEDVQPKAGQSRLTAAPLTDPVTLTAEEKLNVTLKRDGGMSNFDVQGTLSLQIINQEDGLIQVQIETGGSPGILFKTHPNMNKELFSNENILGLKDPNRPFPTGPAADAAGVGLLKWRMQSADESMVPLNINCWPSVSGNETYIRNESLNVKQEKIVDNCKEIQNSESSSVQHLKEEVVVAGCSAVNDGDSLLKKSWRKPRKRKDRVKGYNSVANRTESLVDTCDVFREDEENLEENAARILSSRFDPSCTGFSPNSKLSVSPSENELSFLLSSGQNASSNYKNLSGSESASVDTSGRILRPRKSHKEKSSSRKRRHFYEIFSGDLDAGRVLNRRIKVFWPLDKNWYYGLVYDYDKERKLHHVKYDDRDEEWIDLRNERFKLLLFPSELPYNTQRKRSRRDRGSDERIRNVKLNKEQGKKNFITEDDSANGSYKDSEPIISWLARSSHRVKSCPLRSVKRQKTSASSHSSPGQPLSYDEAVDENGGHDGGSLNGSKAKLFNAAALSNRPVDGRRVEDSSMGSTSYPNRRHPIVYFRRRFRKTDKVLCQASKGNCIASSASESITFLGRVEKFQDLGVLDACLRRLDPERDMLFSDNAGQLQINISLIHSKRFSFGLTFPVLSVSNNLFGTESLWVVRTLLLLQCGTVMSVCPMVHMEILFVDNEVGLKFYLFEGSLKQAIAFVFQVLMVFYQPTEQEKCSDLQLPVTSIRLKLSCSQDFRRQIVFPFYNFHDVKHSKWLSLDSKLKRHCLLNRQLPPSECTYDNIKALKSGSNQLIGSPACKDSSPAEKYTNGDQIVDGTSASSHEPEEFGAIAIGLWKKQCDTSESQQHVLPSKSPSDGDKKNAACGSVLNSIGVEIPPFDQYGKHVDSDIPSTQHSTDLTWNMTGGIIPSPNPTAPRSTWHRNRISSSVGYHAHGWSDGKADFVHSSIGNGPKKPRTQVSYSMPFGSSNYSSKNKGQHQKGLPYKRIRRSNEKRSSDVSRDSQRNLELLCCDANVLVTIGDRGWRECGVQVVLELFDHNGWKLAVKVSGSTRYSYKAHQFLQPGSTNRFTHAMMWKGGKGWILEFTDRSQWALFKEMHEECYNRNVRADSVKNIPIPGVRLIEEYDENMTEVTFVRCSSNYLRQVETDVEMALDPSRVLYDMDSDDEQWISRIRESSEIDISSSLEFSDEIFEKIMDMFEKAAYTQQCSQFTSEEIEELTSGAGSMKVITVIYGHWQQKRQRVGMPLIRHLQPPLWERYQQQVRDWEQTRSKANCKSIEKPPMFAFCMKPRGLELPNKGSKHRSHRKLSVSGQSQHAWGYHEGCHSFGRRSNGFLFGDEKVLYPAHNYDSLEDSPLSQASPRLFSPRDAGCMGYFPMGSNRFDKTHLQRLQRSKSKKYGTFLSSNEAQMMDSYNQRLTGKRNGIHRWNRDFLDWPSQQHYFLDGFQRHGPEQWENSDIDEFTLRDASSAAQHALKIAKFKRGKAQRLLFRADLAIHKAVVALMIAEAIKESFEDLNGDG